MKTTKLLKPSILFILLTLLCYNIKAQTATLNGFIPTQLPQTPVIAGTGVCTIAYSAGNLSVATSGGTISSWYIDRTNASFTHPATASGVSIANYTAWTNSGSTLPTAAQLTPTDYGTGQNASANGYYHVNVTFTSGVTQDFYFLYQTENGANSTSFIYNNQQVLTAPSAVPSGTACGQTITSTISLYGYHYTQYTVQSQLQNTTGTIIIPGSSNFSVNPPLLGMSTPTSFGFNSPVTVSGTYEIITCCQMSTSIPSITGSSIIYLPLGISTTIPITIGPTWTLSATQVNPTCLNLTGGSATASVSPSTSGIVYSWTGSGISSSNATISNLSAGSYTVKATDVNGCSASENVVLPAPSNCPCSNTFPSCTGNVGININGTPCQALTVGGGVLVDADAFNSGTINNALTFGSCSSGEGIGSNQSASPNTLGLDFYTNNINRVAITNAGYVGIGNTNPSYQLTNGGSASSSMLLVDMSSLGGYAGIDIKGGSQYNTGWWPDMGFSLVNTNNSNIIGANIVGSTVSNTAGSEAMDLYFATKPSGSPVTERMRISNSGQIGIGTNSPTQLVHLYNGTLQLQCAAAGNDGISFRTLSNTNYSGNPYGDWAIQYNVQSTGSTGVAGLNFWKPSGCSNGNTANNILWLSDYGSVGVGTNAPRTWVSGGYTQGGPSSNTLSKLDVAGLTITNTLVVSSDARFKTSIASIKDALDKVKLLNGVTYVWNKDKYPERNFDNLNQAGFLAQDVEKVFPQAVVKDQNGFYGMNYNAMLPLLTEAIKELSGKADSVTILKQALDNTNAALANNNVAIAALQKQLDDICTYGCAGLNGSNTNDQSVSPANKLLQNVPNPFAQQTTIGYVINVGTTAYLLINGLDGKQLKQIPLAVNGAGSVIINSNELASGTYTYTLVVDGKIVDTKLMVMTAKD